MLTAVPPSVKSVTLNSVCVATVRQVVVVGLGRRPHVRGNAMNPVAHPLGGGEGHSNGGRQHCSPTGVPSKGFKTRRVNHPSDKFIIRRRKK